MLDRYRSKIGAIGLAIAIFLASVSAYWLIDSAIETQSTYQNAAKNRADNYAKRRDVIEKDRCPPLPSKEEAACVNEERETARQGYRDEYDLEAQRVTANWTAHMGIAAIIGMAASLIGVGLVFFTFRETQRTAQIAQFNLDAYRDTEGGEIVPEIEWTWTAVNLRGRNIGKSAVQIIYADAIILPFDKDVKHEIGLKLSDKILHQNLSIKSEGAFPFPAFAKPESGIFTIAGGMIYRDLYGRLKLCRIGLDIIPSSNSSHASGQILFGKWMRAIKDLESGKHVLPAAE